jgi:hypothetical protein
MLPHDARAVAEHVRNVFIRPALLQQFRSESMAETMRVRAGSDAARIVLVRFVPRIEAIVPGAKLLLGA